METIVRNSAAGIYAATPDYVHALEVRNPSRFLYVSGTMQGLDTNASPARPSPTRWRWCGPTSGRSSPAPT